MSKIQVDAIEQQTACGTTLTAGGGAGKTVVVDATTVTLGRCGGTVALASGASQTGFGRTGTVDWITTPKTATFTAVSGEGYFCNTSGGAFTVNLPAGVAGAIVSVADYAATWQTNNLTVSPNGTDKIGSINSNVILNTEGQSVTFVFVDSTQGWINTMDSTSNVRGIEFISATGGTITTSGNCKIHTFTGPGSFTVNNAAACAAQNIMSYVVVAGGGGGAKGCRVGGGGAGGYREVKNPVTPYTASPLDGYPSSPNRITVTATTFPITVGGGGAAGSSGPFVPGITGSSSVFSTITSTGGGGGGGGPSCSVGGGGLAGGSGGGGAHYNSGGGAGNTPPVSPAQGQNGGNGVAAVNAGSGGGGGAGAVGGNACGSAPGQGGPGGNGVTSSINASPVTRAGGGGGGGDSGAKPGGSGGGGASGNPGVTGTTNTGGGGGGTTAAGAAVNGGAGGSGIVIIRYKFQ